jgi:hypothetical protein
MLTMYEAGDLITMCPWCRRVEIDGEWERAPQAALSVTDAVCTWTLSDSLCPRCDETWEFARSLPRESPTNRWELRAAAGF